MDVEADVEVAVWGYVKIVDEIAIPSLYQSFQPAYDISNNLLCAIGFKIVRETPSGCLAHPTPLLYTFSDVQNPWSSPLQQNRP